ncbi:MAG: GerW family sporulation protein [Clostridia bacterium]|nr:GerW family sporulation protein [Clostridia bacterium]
MGEHPINNLMSTVMENIKGMIDVDTVIGEPVETSNGTMIIPISKVGFGFAAGGSDIPSSGAGDKSFGGGSGAGVSISPVGFLVVTPEQIKMVPVSSGNTPVDKIIDYIPVAIDKVNNMINKKKEDAE